MIESLHISNYALIDKIDIDFHPGFNIITGETGAGKSIILGALSLILGERADTKVVRDQNKKSIIEAIFSFEENVFIKKYCIENDLEWVDKQCILRREIAPNGRTRAFVNDTPVSLSQLQEIASQLIDIHSQHQNRLISSAEFQINIIDSLAHNDKLLTEYITRYTTFRNAVKKLKGAREYIAKNNLENIVSLPGFTPNPYSIIKEHDLFVCSSRAEGYSTAVTEALILGLPVITTDCSGMRELLGENNEYGVVVQNDEESLYNGIKKFLENKSYLEFYTTKAIDRGKKFSLTSLMNEIEDIL